MTVDSSRHGYLRKRNVRYPWVREYADRVTGEPGLIVLATDAKTQPDQSSL